MIRRFYDSHVDLVEIEAITNDRKTYEAAIERMQVQGALTDEGRPDKTYLNALAGSLTPIFCHKLNMILSTRRVNGPKVFKTLQALYNSKEYTGAFLYMAIMYGLLGWRVPEEVACLPAAPEVLKVYMGEFIADFEEYLNEKVAEKELSDSGDQPE